MTPFSSCLDGIWNEIGGGVTMQLTNEINVLVTGSYDHSLDSKGWDGHLRLIARW